jgi:hypothetical protein
MSGIRWPIEAGINFLQGPWQFQIWVGFSPFSEEVDEQKCYQNLSKSLTRNSKIKLPYLNPALVGLFLDKIVYSRSECNQWNPTTPSLLCPVIIIIRHPHSLIDIDKT